MTKPLRLLLVEDSVDDAELIRLELQSAGFELDWKRVESEHEFVAALDEPWDIIISDYRMPDFDGLRAFDLFSERELDTPFIFVSGALGEERAVEAMRAGARDYLLKGELARLSAAVRRELAEARSRAERRLAEEAAVREQRRLAMAVEASGAGVFEHRIPPTADTYHSRRWAEILGFRVDELPPPEERLVWLADRIHPEDITLFNQTEREFIEGRSERCAVDLRVSHRDGHWVDVAWYAKAIDRDDDGRAEHVVGVMFDLVDRRKLEEQLREAQKMEAVGRLAGGIAHDFNNLLTAIFSFGSFAIDSLPEDHPARDDMQEVLNAADRAAALTGQLLAFSRRKPVSPRVINVNEVVGEMDRMLRRVVGEDVDIAAEFAADLWNAHIDPGSLEQVVVNLAVNARDAMPEGGTITIETNNVHLDEAYGRVHGLDVPPGEYVLLAISDDGLGMDEETQQHIFEPFFTTKEVGKGTGLGLSTCHGIIRQANGYIWVYSEPGEGTTFKIYLPRIRAHAERTSARSTPDVIHGSETILIAEDDEQVRRLCVRTLKRFGYEVLEASDGEEALLECERATTSIDLLLTDVVMPNMSGKELAERLLPMCEGARVLYMSGYTENAIVHRGILEPGTEHLPKPFTPQALAHRVRMLLDE